MSTAVSVDILRSIQDRCSAFQTSRQTAVCDIVAQSCSDVDIRCGNEARQTFVCNGSQLPDAISGALAARAAIDGIDLRSALSLNKDATDVDVQTQVRTVISNTCDSAQKAQQFVRVNFNCKKSKDVVVKAMNRLDQTAACGLLAADALYSSALKAAGKSEDVPDNEGGRDPRLSQTTAMAIAISVTVVLLLVIILCGVLVNRHK